LICGKIVKTLSIEAHCAGKDHDTKLETVRCHKLTVTLSHSFYAPSIRWFQVMASVSLAPLFTTGESSAREIVFAVVPASSARGDSVVMTTSLSPLAVAEPGAQVTLY